MSGDEEIHLTRLAKACMKHGLQVRWGAWGFGLGDASKRWHAWNGGTGATSLIFVPVFREGRLYLIREEFSGARDRLPAHTRKEMSATLRWWLRGEQK